MAITGIKSGRTVQSMSFSINRDMLDKLTAYCSERGCSRSWLISKALEAYLAECLEDKADYETAAEAWKEFEKKGGKTYTSDDLRKEFGL